MSSQSPESNPLCLGSFHILLPVSCNVSCLKHLNDVLVLTCLSLIQNVLARLMSWHLCLGKCLCLGKNVSRLRHLLWSWLTAIVQFRLVQFISVTAMWVSFKNTFDLRRRIRLWFVEQFKMRVCTTASTWKRQRPTYGQIFLADKPFEPRSTEFKPKCAELYKTHAHKLLK